MIMLGISTSSKYASAAVMKPCLKQDKVVSLYSENGQRTGRSHSQILMELIDKALRNAETDKEELEAIAVDVGPGSFTGVRIGVSCANAMAYALGIPVIPVCSLTALCLGNEIYVKEIDDPDLLMTFGQDANVKAVNAALIDCRNGNCYAAAYDDEFREIISPCAAVTSEILEKLPVGRTLFAGDVVGKDRSEYAYPNAGQVLIAAQRLRTEPVKQAVPTYLRPSQAERMKTIRD